jgi:peptidoglycan/LPS O-acetylase OafA/YrhL
MVGEQRTDLADFMSAAPEPTNATLPVATVSLPRLPTIDVFRGIAILLVILYHINGNIIFPEGWGLVRGSDGVGHIGSGLGVLRFVLLPFHFGRVGVNLFFVISGLCIHLRFAFIQTTAPNAAFPLKVFFLRRFFRIYPVYWTALALGILVGPFIYSAASSPSGTIGAVKFPTVASIASHVVMLHGFFADQMMDILRVLWSIATEEQFYLLYPLVFVAIGRRVSVPRLVLVLLGLSFAWRALFVFSNPPPLTFSDGPFLVWLFGFSLARYYEWSLGALLAWAMANQRTLAIFPARPIRFLGARPGLVMVIGVGLILVGAASLLRVRVKWMIEDPCYSTGWFLILSAALLPSAAASRLRRPGGGLVSPVVGACRSWVARRLASLGRRSYSVYLLHELPLMATVALMHRFSLPPIAVAAPLTGLLIWVVCYPFYRYVEAPFERRSKAVGARARRQVADHIANVA